MTQQEKEEHPKFQSSMSPEKMVPTSDDIPVLGTRSVEELTRAVLNAGAQTTSGEFVGGSK
jgi:hypothetical protein